MQHTDREVDTTFEQAKIAAAAGDHRTVILLLKRLDRLGVWSATAQIGQYYERGAIGVSRDLDEAVKWYRKSIFESDDLLGHLGLGRIYFEGGATVELNYQKAREHLTRAYRNGFPEAGVPLGQMSLFGLGTEKNATEAKRYFNDAATANYPIAYKYLAYISAQSGEFRTAVVLACRGVLLTWRLRLEDRGHPNLWR